MNRDNGGPAFPEQISTDCAGEKYSINPGMTLRDYFAAKAMQGYIVGTDQPDEKVIAKVAYEVADAMLKERAQ